MTYQTLHRYLFASSTLLLLGTGCISGSEDFVEVQNGMIVSPWAQNNTSTSATNSTTTTPSNTTSTNSTNSTSTSTTSPSSTSNNTSTSVATSTSTMTIIEPGPANKGWIGGPCTSTTSCTFEDAVCLASGAYPTGQCTQSCEKFCPDRDGSNSQTFCIEAPESSSLSGGGQCVSQCDWELYPSSGCRKDYTCTTRTRFNQTSVQKPVCVPSDQVDPVDPGDSDCLADLTQKGVVWSSWNYQTRAPSNAPNLMCTIDDPILVQPSINGVSYSYYNQTAPKAMYMSCNMAQALWKMGDVVKPYGINRVLHIGTFNCRKISGKDKLSQHSHGRAIDIWGFVTEEGDRLILEDHWEHETTMPSSSKAQTLYEIGQAMHTQKIFHNVLTPNYNAGHDNHFHVDLAPGADFIGSTLYPEHGYFGPDQWEDHCPGEAEEVVR